jgi:hypothetical protein
MEARAEAVAKAQHLLDAAAAHLFEAVGDLSLCAISKSGESLPAAKYYEGRTAALSALVRAMRHHDVSAALEHTHLRFDTVSGLRGPDWEAYRHGVRDALDEAEASIG